MTEAWQDTWFRIDPIDSVAVRDGRPFDAGGDYTFASVPPRPSTVTGALHRVVGVEGFSRGLRFTGPLQYDEKAGQPVFPWPRDVVQGIWGEMSRLKPCSFAGVAFDSTDLPCQLLDGSGDPPPGEAWISAYDLASYLDGSLDPGEVSPTGSGWVADSHVGLQKGANRSAVTGMLYSAEHIRLRSGWQLRARVQHQGRLATSGGLVPFGGERRMAEVSVARKITLPDAPSDFPDGRVLAYLISPAVFDDGWRLPVPEGARLVAATISGPVALSTWGKFNTRNTFVLRHAVAEGSVYYLQFASESAAARWSSSVHGNCLPQASTKLRSAGFGWCLTGRWS